MIAWWLSVGVSLATALILAFRLASSRRLLAELRTKSEQIATESRAREELLSAVVHEAPSATILLDDQGTVRFANRAARAMFFGGREAVDTSLSEVLRGAPEALRRALGGDATELVALENEGDREVLHVTKRAYASSDGQEVLTIVTAQPLTSELLREEVTAYKKLVRVLGHELNNSLAPVASLALTGQRLVAAGDYAEVPTIFRTMGERVEHLRTFLHGYGAMARLPRPNRTDVDLDRVFTRLRSLFPGVVVPSTEGAIVFVDEVQIEQVLINLIKNAHEAESPMEAIEIDVSVEADGSNRLVVSDRGHGLSDEVLASALVPFFSTKEGGAGLGLAVCREIVENHGGRLRLRARERGGGQVFVRLPGRLGRLGRELSWSTSQ